MTEAVNSGALVRSSNGQVSNQAQDAAPAHNNENQENVQQAAPQPQPAFSYWSVFKGLLFRAAIIYFMTSWFRGQPANQNTGGGSGPPGATPASSNLYPNGTVMDMYMYISEDSTFKSFDDPEALVWKEPGLVYGDWYGGPNGDSVYTKNMRFRPSERVKNNGTIFLHVFFVLNGYSPDPKAEKDYSQTHTVYRKKQLNKYKKLRYKRTQNLLTGETAATPEMVEKAEAMKEEILSHWHPNLTVNIIVDHTPWTQGQVPMPVDQYVEFEPTTGKYYPIVYINDYWNLIRDYQAINETTEWLDLQLTFQPLSMFRWQLYVAQGMRSFSFFGQDLMEESEEDKDSLKEAFLETSPYLLAVTVVVSLLHSVFEFLAFKSDIQFWRNRKSLEGLSVRSVFFNVFQSAVVLLYILDNDTNTLVRLSVFVGLLIDIWKIHKVVNITVDRENKLFGVFPRIRMADKCTYVESSTREYDMMAFKYLSWALFPLLAAYCVYSLMYLEHKSWYSWVLGVMYGFLLTFGFIMMTPQLFINYKLKSVAHLPWRMLTYKFLNTFIDDIFAFVIKMPTMYRLGCFRDDIVFLIFLYQRWIYRVDPTRVNEFGTSAVDDATPEMAAAAEQPNGALPTAEAGDDSTSEKPEELKKNE
ncbi:putative lipid scramblase CLPTM1 [Rhipicephalus microplus]|nr:cleft lip and palate transmembrane protein 1 homolog [Rhipicephalus microplus]